MAKNEAMSGFLSGLASAELYKRTQGRRLRRMTAGILIGWVLFGCWTMSEVMLADATRPYRVGVPVVIAVVLSWVIFRLVNMPRFADFLIAVEAEMKKVSWPTIGECFRAAIVVIVVMFLLSITLFLFDQLWIWFFKLIGVLQMSSTTSSG